ncbi:MAG: glycine--tRNA ligase subunit beta [Elusimicrobia bacterium]|nr:glycine--tRNA ligase subunit beta [Elusimicrobiota bacterium]
MAKNTLLEIYTEEIPANFIPPVIANLRELTKKFLDEQKLEYKNVTVWATPRRLAVYIDGLVEKTKEETIEVMGPPVKIAKDENGEFTKVGLGFANTQGIKAENLQIKNTPKGDYYYITKQTGGQLTEKVLPEIFTKIITKIYFPKTMVWNESKFKFVRPIKSIIALHGAKPVKLTIAGIKSGVHTYGLYIKSSKKLKVALPEKYTSILRDNYVIVDQQIRKGNILSTANQAIKKIGGKVEFDEKLLEEITYLVEHPTAVLCEFDKNFLKLPEIVIITCLEKKQKFFPVMDKNGKLSNYFIGIRNGASEHQEIVKEGYEKVASARLKDAEFFYEQDLKEKLETKTEKLKGIIFQQKLGTVYEKIQRIEKLSSQIGQWLNLDPVQKREISRTVMLCKNDLLTSIVFEYAELQGVIGAIYAEKNGEPENVYSAIEQHYWPLSAQGKLPKTITGAVVSISDKIDTIAGNFAVGLIPTGSADPYGLRRQAIGIVRILIEKKIQIPLKELIQKAIACLPGSITGSQPKLLDITLDFFRQRLEVIFEEKGYKIDEIRSVLSKDFNNLIEVQEKLDAIKEIRKLPDFEPLAAGFKRASNILRQAQQKNLPVNVNQLSADKLMEPEEKDLYQSLERVKKEIQQFIDKKEYLEVLKILVTLREPIDKFFDKVMVMAPDTTLRDNRLALLQETVNLFLNVSDLSQLQ